MDVSSRGPEHFQLFSYLTQSGVRSWLEVASRVHHPFLLTDGVFGEPEQLLTGVGGIRTVWSGTAAHVSSLEHNSNAKFPVIDVQSDNFKELWPALLLGIKSSSFIALDTELSGLGNRKSLLAESIEDRYKAICHAARSRSILSLGIACYKKLEQKASDTYLVQVYNLTLLCSEEYIIEPQSVQFLVQHGFDFNKQYSIGIPYFKGNNKGGSDDRGVHIRALFTELLRAKKPLVLHNGLIDMAFLYQSFYAHLPERLATFTADLSEMFPAGIYDTKYVCEFELRLTASYLEYAYKKCKLETSRSVALDQKVTRVHVEFCQYAAHMSDYVDYRVCPEVSSTAGETDLCQQFSAFGWCPNGSQCPLSHDTDLIILQDEKGLKDKRRKRKRQREKKADGNKAAEDSMFDAAPGNKVAHMMDETTEDDRQKPETLHGSDGESRRNVGESNGDEDKTSLVTPAESKSDDGRAERASKVVNTGTHRAGFDAFMTGYIFAYTCTLDKKAEEQPEGEESWLPTCLNKVYLSGKAAPLNVVKSTFARSSKAHVQKMEMVWGQRV